MVYSVIVLMQYLRVNRLKRDWWLDLPELTSIRLGYWAFDFKDDDSSELIMRSDDDGMKWWIDLPKLTSLTTTERSIIFRFPRIINLEGISYHSILTIRHALSHQCLSWRECIPTQENRSHEESLFLPSLIPRHHSCSPTVSHGNEKFGSLMGALKLVRTNWFHMTLTLIISTTFASFNKQPSPMSFN